MAYRETEKMRTRKAQVRQRILDCAFACVRQGGFQSAQVTQVAASAEVATGTIYRHFESKEALFAEVFRIATQREVDKVAEALATPGKAPDRLATALALFAARAMRGPTMAWALIAEPIAPKVEEERLIYRKAYAEQFERAIMDGVAEGSLPAQDARLTSTCLVGAIAESLVGPLSPTQQASNPLPDDLKQQLIDQIVGFCIQGLTGARR
ncbi:MAG: TetR/AcrR family transcriptional regulator [Marinobacter sp.]|nr:TetR/AcrR family transcriptional regulator [Marinobacter sp.]